MEIPDYPRQDDQKSLASDLKWHRPRQLPSLHLDEIHVWRYDLRAARWALTDFEALLSDDERIRASRFVFFRDRCRFIATRGALRKILGEHLRLDPVAIQFSYGPQEKPYLVHLPGQRGLSFNVSHSQDLALLAFGWDRQIGVDVECVGQPLNITEVVQEYFTAAEATAIQTAPPHLRDYRFLSFWTRKEAYVKALGCGLSLPLNAFDVSGTDGMGCAELDPENIGDVWSLLQFEPADGYVAALLWRGSKCDVHAFEWHQ